MFNILNDQEKDKVHAFVTDDVMREAVRKVLLAGLYSNGTLKPGESADPARNFALSLAFNAGEYSDEMLGANLRACARGIELLQNGFNMLENFKQTPIPSPVDVNDAV